MVTNVLPLVLIAAAIFFGMAWLQHASAKGWSVTYEVTSDSSEAPQQLTYLQAKQRGDNSTKSTTNTTAPSWRHRSFVTAGQPAEVTATPPTGHTSHCKIILNRGGHEKVLTEGNSMTPGGPAVCKVVANP